MKSGIAFSECVDTKMRDKFLRLCANAGFETIDFQAPATTELPLYDDDFNTGLKYALDFKKAVESFGMTVSQTHGPWRWPPIDDTVENRRERFEKMVRCIRINASIECPYTVIHPIYPFGTENNDHPEIFRELNLEFFRGLVKEAEKYGVTVCFENMPMLRTDISVPDDTAKFIKEINSPYFKMCLDTGHAAVFGISPADSMRKIGSDTIKVLHVHDNDGTRDAHMFPFEGIINWQDFRSALSETHFDGSVSLETDVNRIMSKPDCVLDGQLKWLHTICDFLTSEI